MNLWPKQMGNIAVSKLHGKLAANSEAVWLNHQAICFFLKGLSCPNTVLTVWSDDLALQAVETACDTHCSFSPQTSDHRWSAAAARASLVPSGHKSAGTVAAADASVSAENLKPIYIGAGACGRWWRLNSLCWLSILSTLPPVHATLSL